MKNKTGKNSLWPAAIPMYIFTLLLVILPLAYIVVISFLSKNDNWGYSHRFTLSNYSRIFRPVYLKTFATSFKLAAVTTALTLLIGYPFGYLMCRLKPRMRGIMLLLVVIPFWTNSLVRLYGWMIVLGSNGVLNGLLLKAGLIGAPLKLLYNQGSTVIGMFYALLPFMILPSYTAVEKMDWSAAEAARDLGAGKMKAFLTVTLRMTMPGITSGCILVFIPSMGLFFISDLLGGAKVMLVGNLIKNELLVSHDWPFGAALSVVMLAMTFAVIFVCAKISGSRTLEGL